MEDFKLWNVICKSMLGRAIRDKHPCGLFLLSMCLDAHHDPAGIAKPRLHRLCDYYLLFKDAYGKVRHEGKRMFRVGATLTNGVLTQDGYAAMAREGNVLDPPAKAIAAPAAGGGGSRRESSSRGDSRKDPTSSKPASRPPPKPSQAPRRQESRGSNHYDIMDLRRTVLSKTGLQSGLNALTAGTVRPAGKCTPESAAS